jgi:alpha-glucosidase
LRVVVTASISAEPAGRGWMHVFASVLAGLVLLPGALATPVSLGPATAAARLANGARLTLAGGGTLTVEFLDGGIAHVKAAPPGVASLATGATLSVPPPSQPLTFFEDAASVYLVQGPLAAVVVKNPLQVVLLRADGTVLSADVPDGVKWDPGTGMIAAQKFARAGERYFGMGLVGGPLDRRGRQLWMRNTDSAGWSEGTNPLYSSTPYFVGHADGRSYGLFLDSPSIAFFDFDSAGSGVFSMAAFAGALNYFVLAGPGPADVTRAFGKLTGNTPLPPHWALGYWQSRFGYRSADEILALAREFRARRIPCDGFFLDLDYMDRLQLFSWSPDGFPDPAAFNSEMEALGFKRVLTVEPLLTVFDRLWPFFRRSNFFLREPGGEPVITDIFLGEVSWIDFTRPAVRDFFRAQLAAFVAGGGGVSGLWADLNEPAANAMPQAIYDFGGAPRSDLAARNVFALHETAVFAQALAEARPGLRTFVLSRSGFPGIQRNAANWSGDSLATFEALRAAVQVSVSMGLSGQNLFGHDVGGFIGSPNAELFLRWLQFGAATPFLRNHANFGTEPREPWRFGDAVTAAARSTIEWRYRLMPYLYGLFADAERDGAPVLSPTYFHFPSDPATHAQNGEFMLGPALLVAPVVTEGTTVRALHLPAGASWIDYYTDAAYSGGQPVEVAAPVERLPVLVRAGSIVPMGPVRQHAADTGAEYLLLDVFAGGEGAGSRFTLHEDDGVTTAYRNGRHRRTPLAWSETAADALLAIGPASGTYTQPVRPWWVQVRGWSRVPRSVTADGVALPPVADPQTLGDGGGWGYDQAARRLVIRLPGSGPAGAVHIER